ncbi:hypothetical protein K466DRAFT_571517 [Polyporus arcularius HHB13444]|uniref:F-box domain-containing protein n=1 Tax=Polyporus arcularius HHB13444 TaxID=1314778 RepID=A0A5C3Q1F8_9APHY|nr:hypothetical protein K466DRAFT_571517 [Polyporus arcularius HHB13444]
MGPLWQIINVDRREANTNIWGQLGAWFFYPHDQLINHLSVPCLPQEIDGWLTEGRTIPPPGPISKLPAELIHDIFDELNELHEVVYLAITCKLLLSIGKSHILRATKAYYAPWVGCRLIALSDDTQTLDDLPSGLLTDVERNEIETAKSVRTDGPDADEHEKTLSCLSRTSFERVFHTAWRMHRSNIAVQHHHRICNWTVPDEPDCGDTRMFRTLYGDGRRATYPEGTRVLCNLSKGEYVREDGLTSPKYVNLAHALLSRICWSASTDVGMACEDGFRAQLTRGPWAGDRFCITTLELLPELDSEGSRSWTDVTREVHALLSHVWNNNERLWNVYRSAPSR